MSQTAPLLLRRMTWNHPRGYDPMVATALTWHAQTGVEITWEQRSLQDFESVPVEELARAYDLIVIDHPHVGQVTAEACLLPLDVPGREAERAELSTHSVGQSYASYNWQGRQWAFPIDAAAQVMVWRPDLLDAPPKHWGDVVKLARAGQVILPLRPPHNLMSFFTLCANLGQACANGPGTFCDEATGAEAFELLREMVSLIPKESFDMDPIAASEAMARAACPLALMPLSYGYVNYALDGFRERRLSFGNIPAAGTQGPLGSALGGTGIAVSAFSDHPQHAIDYAYWVASAEVQRTLYAASGGQPGHAEAWEDEAVNAPTGNFYRQTRETLERAYVRPRHNGYMAFQQAASLQLNAGLRSRAQAGETVEALLQLYEESF